MAFVLIKTNTGEEDEVFDAIKNFSEVKEVYKTHGFYDIIARIDTNNMRDLKYAINSKIKRIRKIISTLISIIVDS